MNNFLCIGLFKTRFSLFYLYLSTLTQFLKSAAKSRLRILDRSFDLMKYMLPGGNKQLGHWQMAGVFTCFYIINNNKHSLYSALPAQFQPIRQTRRNSQFSAHVLDNFYSFIFCLINQVFRAFTYKLIKVWNALPKMTSFLQSILSGLNQQWTPSC